MIDDIKQIKYFKEIAEMQFVLLVTTDYGIDRTIVTQFTDTISSIYRYLQYNTFQSVIIYKPLNDDIKLSNLSSVNPVEYLSYENTTPLAGNNIIIEIKDNGNLDILTNHSIGVDALRDNAIIYEFIKSNENEVFYGKTQQVKLLPIPETDSHFAIRSYKTIELALEDYKVKVAQHSDCPLLKNVWFEKNMLFLKKAPEHTLRDSLTLFLKRLRNAEVRPEQVVDKSHPVDIKVTWALANRLALIEIKWLGKSLKHRNKQFTNIYSDSRALSGAKQLSEYLEANLIQSPTYATKGYLVVFDARRAACSSGLVEELDAINALKYLNQEINYSPDYSVTRTDFSKPYRFFMQPKYITT